MWVQVLQKHIDTGTQGNNRWCPVALALQDVGFSQGELMRTDILPRSVSRFIGRFDRGKEVHPFNFIWPA